MIVEICLSFFGRGAVMQRARNEVKALLKAGKDVTVITDLIHRRYLNFFKDLEKKPKFIPIKLIYLFGPTRKVIGELSFAIRLYQALKSISYKENIELIVCHGSSYCFAVGCFAKRRKIPTAFVIQELINERIKTSTNPYNWYVTKWYQLANRYAISKIEFFIADSSYMKKFIIKEGAFYRKTYILHNPVDLSIFSPKHGIQKEFDILFIGRLSIEKGVEVLIKASKFISKNRKILIIGDGSLYKKLEIMACNTSKNIKFQGWVDHEELPKFIRKSKILVVPSLSEPQGVVVLEAFACGVPVIGTYVGGIPDMIVHNKNGCLIKPNDSRVLGETIDNVLKDEKKLHSFSQESLKTVQKFSLTKFNIKIVKLYEKLING